MIFTETYSKNSHQPLKFRLKFYKAIRNNSIHLIKSQKKTLIAQIEFKTLHKEIQHKNVRTHYSKNSIGKFHLKNVSISLFVVLFYPY